MIGVPERRRSISYPSSSLTERTTSPLHSKNGGREYFDEASGKFKRWPVGQKEPGEVVRRVRLRGRTGEEGNRRVNKVLKRRKKYKKLPVKSKSKEDEKNASQKEEEEDNKLPVLDLGLNVNRKKKKIEFSVHYKKTHTNITIKKISNHTNSTERGIIK